METNNETVEQVCSEMTGWEHHTWMSSTDHEHIKVLAERILAAHKREMNALAAQKTAEAHEAFVKNAELADAIAAKDAEIARLRKSLDRFMEVTGDCRKCEEDGDESCPWYGEPGGCNNREACAKFLAGELVDPLKAKDAEIERLRTLVKDLAQALNASCDCHRPCHGCDMADESKFDCAEKAERALVAKAREVAK